MKSNCGNKITQREAVIQALELFGGEASTSEIVDKALVLLGDNFKGKTPWNSIRSQIYRTPEVYQVSEGRYRLKAIEENKRLKQRVLSLEQKCHDNDRRFDELESKFKDNQKTIDDLLSKIESFQKIETAIQYKKRLLSSVINLYKRHLDELDEFRKLFVSVGECELAESIDKFLIDQENERKSDDRQTMIMEKAAEALQAVASKPPQTTHYYAEGAKHYDNSKQLNIMDSAAEDGGKGRLIE